MARRRSKYFVTNGELVVIKATARELVWGDNPPLILTRRPDADRLAARAGGYVVRVAGNQKAEFHPWWA